MLDEGDWSRAGRFAGRTELSVGAEHKRSCGDTGTGLEFLVLVLEAVELPVDAAVREELLVRAVLTELAFVHDEDGVGALHGGEAVCDDDRGAAGYHAVERGADADLGVGVD
jgi:hypothetical protein